MSWPLLREARVLVTPLGCLPHHSRQQLLFLELLGEISLGAFYARVHLHVERFARRVFVRRKAEGVLPWNGHGAPGRTRRVAGNGGDGIFRARRARRRVAQIPYPAVHARSARKSFGDANPIARDQLLPELFRGRLGFVSARKFAHDLSLGVEDFERHGSGGSLGERIIDDRSEERRVGKEGRFRWWPDH